MNHKQKLGYMVLGALILAIGITIGQFITPNIEAQQNGFFDQITCRRLYVEDQHGKTAIVLGSNEDGNTISICDPNGEVRPAIGLHSNKIVGNGILIYHPNGKEAIGLHGNKIVGNTISIYDPNGKTSFQFNADTASNELIVRNKSDGAGIGFYADYNEARQIRWNPLKKE